LGHGNSRRKRRKTFEKILQTVLKGIGISQKLDDNDILIAGIMLANGITKIITKNVNHFERIKEIKIIEY